MNPIDDRRNKTKVQMLQEGPVLPTGDAGSCNLTVRCFRTTAQKDDDDEV
jgi:hypothetical protein